MEQKVTAATSRKSRPVVISLADAAENLRLVNSIAEGLPITAINGFASLVNFVPSAGVPIHRWFRYREGYSVELVKKIIGGLPRGSVVLDPFCGCGSTLLAAQELGYESYGFDVNPLSTLVARVKTRPYKKAQVETLKGIANAVRAISKTATPDPVPQFDIIGKVFHQEILEALLISRRFIKSIQAEEIREFVFLAWLSILEDVSNVYKEGNGIKYRNRKRLPDGYITISNEDWQRKVFPENKHDFVLKRLDAQLSLMLADLERVDRSEIAKAHVINAPAEQLCDYVSENSVAISVFSPPYCNCFNYFKAFKVELWMGEFVQSYHDMQLLNRSALRSHVETVLSREGDGRIPEVESFAELLDGEKLWDRRIPNAVRGYFQDMRTILGELKKVTKPSGKCVAVVGNSAYGGVLIPTDALLAKIAQKDGYTVSQISVARHLTTSSQQRSALDGRQQFLRESIIFLEKPDPRLVDMDLVYVDELPVKPTRGKGSVFVIKNNGLTSLTHKFHRYPAKFIPHVPRWGLKRHLEGKKDQVVLDPFAGSGTTLVEAVLAGHRAYGIDVDPIGRLVSKVKTTPIPREVLVKCVHEVTARLAGKVQGQFQPTIPTLSHWFSSSAVNELGAIRDVVETYKTRPDLYRFLLVCFIAVVRRASNADNQTQKTYVSHTKIKTPVCAKKIFLHTLADYSARLMELADRLPRPDSAIVLPFGDARNIAEIWAAQRFEKVDLVVTSPPYLKSVDYVYNQMAEYFWVGDLFGLETQAKQNDYKRMYIGTNRFSVAECKVLPVSGITSVDEVAARVFKKSKKDGYILAQYFVDMITHLRQLSKVLKVRSNAVYVVGDSVVSGVPISVHELLQHCATSVGFSVDCVFGYEIRNRHMRFPRNGRGGIVRYDWVIDLSWKRENG